MPTLSPMTRVPGIGLPTTVSVRLAIDLSLRDDWYLYAIVAPYEARSTDGRPPIARDGLHWAPAGVWLRDRHDGPILGASTDLWDTPTGLLGVFRLVDDAAARAHVLGVVKDGARLSPRYSFTSADARGHSRGMIAEASLVPDPAFADAYVLGLYTPQLMLIATDHGEFTGVPGPRAPDYLLERELLDAIADRGPEDALRVLDSIPVENPAPALVAEGRAAMRALVDEPATRSSLEMAPVTLELEVRSAGGRNYLDCRCVPYGTISARVPGRRPERFRAGAFAGTPVERIKLTDNNHGEGRRPVGIATQLDERHDGLYGTFRFFNTPEGRAAHENVAEGTYGGVSIGFVALDDPTVDGIREIRRARLDHVSLVDDPAYAGADILALRGST